MTLEFKDRAGGRGVGLIRYVPSRLFSSITLCLYQRVDFFSVSVRPSLMYALYASQSGGEFEVNEI